MGIFEKIWPKENPKEDKKNDNELSIDPNTGLVETKGLKEIQKKIDEKKGDDAWREQA